MECLPHHRDFRRAHNRPRVPEHLPCAGGPIRPDQHRPSADRANNVDSYFESGERRASGVFGALARRAHVRHRQGYRIERHQAKQIVDAGVERVVWRDHGDKQATRSRARSPAARGRSPSPTPARRSPPPDSRATVTGSRLPWPPDRRSFCPESPIVSCAISQEKASRAARLHGVKLRAGGWPPSPASVTTSTDSEESA